MAREFLARDFPQLVLEDPRADQSRDPRIVLEALIETAGASSPLQVVA